MDARLIIQRAKTATQKSALGRALSRQIKPLSQLRRAPFAEVLGGVCSGVAYWCGAPAWIIRVLVFAGFWLTTAPVFLAYAGLWLAMPKWRERPKDFESRAGA